MALSRRELTLVLRARDEATRTIGRLSGSMSRLDRDSRRISMAQVRQSEDNLRSMRRQVHAIEETYRQQTVAAREAYLAGRMNHKQYQSTMLLAQKTRVNQQAGLRVLREAEEDNIRNQKEHLRLLGEEREAYRHRGQMMISQGAFIATMGAGMTYFGIRGLEAWTSNIKAALDYEQAVARSFTQVDKAGASLQEISDLGKEVADTLPVAFEEIQPAIYDIFSSIDTNLEGSRTLIKQFSKDAVGGTAKLEVATRANLAIMNAYGVSVEDASKVSDFMFRLVQKGVGTYDEFAKTIGRAIPSAARAGQSYQTLGAMLAFMTRNGVSAAMAATSSARALDAISKTKVQDRLKEMGIETRNAAGEFRKLPDILNDMDEVFGKMATPERAKALEKLFLGAGGTIQARRFFDMYFSKSKQFNKRVKEMTDVAGEAEKAFNTMAETPQAKLQRLQNNWELLRIELGEHLMPTAMKLVDWINQMFDAWEKLDPETRKNITTTAALATALLTLAGIFTIIGGAVWAFNGAAMALNTTMSALLIKFGLIAGGAYLIYKGFGHIEEGASNAEKALGLFEATLGAAAIGMAVGGPWGAAIGGTIGLFGTLISQFGAAGREARDAYNEVGKLDPVKEAKKSLDDLKGTLDQVTGAYTAATRAAILQKIEENGLADAAREAGVPLRAIVNAAMGQKNAFSQIKPVMQTYKSDIKDLQAKIDELKESSDSYTEQDSILGPRKVMTTEAQNAITALEKEKKALEQARAEIKLMPDELRKMGQETREAAAATTDYGNKLKMFPKNIRTKIEATGIEPSIKGVAKVAKQYKLVDKKEIKALIKASGADATVKQVQRVMSKMKEVDKVKPDTKNFMDGISKALVKVLRVAKNGVDDTNKELNKTGKNAKMDGKPLKTSVEAGTRAAASAGKSGAVGIGTAVKYGFPDGFGGAGSLWSAQLAAAVRAAIAAGRKAAKAKSPSVEMEMLAKDMVDGGVIGFKKNGPQLSKAMKQLIRNILRDFDSDKVGMKDIIDLFEKQIERKLGKLKGKARKKKEASILKNIREATEKDLEKLQNIQKRYQKVLKKLEDAKNVLAGLKQERLSYIENVTAELVSYGSLSSIERPVDVFGNQGNFTASGIAAAKAQKLAQIRQFGANLDKLRAMGFSKEVIAEIIAYGIVDGSAVAEALLSATSGEVASINASTSAIASAASELATTAGDQMYNAGIMAAQGVVDGLEAKKDDLEKAAKRIAKAIAKAIREELGMKSPSRVGIKIGMNFGGSLASGLLKQEKMVSRASTVLARATTFDPSTSIYTRRPVVGAQSGGPQTSSAPGSQRPINIYTNEIDPRANAAKLGWELTNRGL